MQRVNTDVVQDIFIFKSTYMHVMYNFEKNSLQTCIKAEHTKK